MKIEIYTTLKLKFINSKIKTKEKLSVKRWLFFFEANPAVRYIFVFLLSLAKITKIAIKKQRMPLPSGLGHWFVKEMFKFKINYYGFSNRKTKFTSMDTKHN